jgi:acyl-CoA dehydrogenase-like protein
LLKLIKPRVMEWDEAQHFPKDLFAKMGALGVMGVMSRKSIVLTLVPGVVARTRTCRRALRRAQL